MKKSTKPEDSALREVGPAYGLEPSGAQMVRTQIYLTRAEHQFLQSEASRRGQPMSAVIRGIIDDRMLVPDDAWTRNPMLEPTPDDPEWEGQGDGAVNHDHYVYGGPKKFENRGGQWELLPPVE